MATENSFTNCLKFKCFEMYSYTLHSSNYYKLNTLVSSLIGTTAQNIFFA